MKVTEAPINNSQLYIEEIETVPEEFTYTSPKGKRLLALIFHYMYTASP